MTYHISALSPLRLCIDLSLIESLMSHRDYRKCIRMPLPNAREVKQVVEDRPKTKIPPDPIMWLFGYIFSFNI